jgi:ATP-binding cassette subfamily B protein
LAAPTPVSLTRALQLARLAGDRLLAANVALQLVQGVVPLLGLVAMKLFLDAVANAIRSADPTFAPIAWSVAFAAAVAAAGALLRAAAAETGDRHARLVADRCASLVQRHAATLDVLQLEDPANADLLQRAAAEAGQRPVRVVNNGAALLLAIVTFVCFGGALATAAPWLPVIVGLAAVPQAWTRLRHVRAQLRWQDERTEAQRELAYRTGLLGSRAAAKDLRLFGLGEAIADGVERRRGELTAEQLALSRARSRGDALAQLLASAVLFLSYLWLGRMALQPGGLTLGDLLLQAQAVQRTQNGIRDGLLAWSGLREDRLFLAHLFAFLALPARIVAPAVPAALPPSPAGFEFAGVRFAYPRMPTEVLRGVDLALRPGERVALIGRNGAGKSTIVRLLCRLCDPDHGAVRHGGVDLRQFDPSAFRRRLSVLFQDAAAFEFSARENLLLAQPDLDDAALQQLLDCVGLGDKLRGLPAGIDTRLGRGFRGACELSVGEWRRLLLARALARRADLLVLDEPFAFLDPDGQQRLVLALRSLPRDRTVLVVEQPRPALAFVDRVLVCDEGRIARDGPPDAVLGAG